MNRRRRSMLSVVLVSCAIAFCSIVVFAADKGLPSRPVVAEGEVDENGVDQVSVDEAGQRFVEALTKARTAPARATEEDESEEARRFREVLQGAREETLQPSGEQEHETIRRFREALEQTRRRVTGSSR